jgi:hypothetical protein
MHTQALLVSNPVAEFLETYRDWRYDYGINDPCINELKAAILAESERESLTTDQRVKLQSLARLIEHEQAALLVRAA